MSEKITACMTEKEIEATIKESMAKMKGKTAAEVKAATAALLSDILYRIGPPLDVSWEPFDPSRPTVIAGKIALRMTTGFPKKRNTKRRKNLPSP